MTREYEPINPELSGSQLETVARLQDVVKDVGQGETIVVYGLPGTGKTTLLQHFAQIQPGVDIQDFNLDIPPSDKRRIISYSGFTVPEDIAQQAKYVVRHSGFTLEEMFSQWSKEDAMAVISKKFAPLDINGLCFGSLTLMKKAMETVKSSDYPERDLKFTIAEGLSPYILPFVGRNLRVSLETEIKDFIVSSDPDFDPSEEDDEKFSKFTKLYESVVSVIRGEADKKFRLFRHVGQFNERVAKGEIRLGFDQLQPLSDDAVQILLDFCEWEAKRGFTERSEPRLEGFANVPLSEQAYLDEVVHSVVIDAAQRYMRKTGVAFGIQGEGIIGDTYGLERMYDFQAIGGLDYWFRDFDRKVLSSIPLTHRMKFSEATTLLGFTAGDHGNIMPDNIGALAGFMAVCEHTGCDFVLDLDIRHGGKHLIYDAKAKQYQDITQR